MRIADQMCLVILTLTTSCVCAAYSPAQQETSGNLALFGRFFSQIAQLRPPTEMIYLNGEPSDLRFPTLQETLGLSDREAALVRAIAVRCEDERNRIDRSDRATTLSARLDSIDGHSENEQYLALLRKRAAIVAAAIDAVKTVLGAPRFDDLAAFVLERSTNLSYFPLRPR